MTSIRSSAFRDAIGLTSITIPNSVTNIDKYAFSSCVNLKNVTIKVNQDLQIGDEAFSSDGLEKFIMNGETLPKSTEENTFNTESYKTAILYVPSSLYEEYRSTSPWNKFVNIRIIDDEISGISENEFEQPCTSYIYDINGRKVTESTLKPGLYIKNGKKLIVK